LGSTNFQAQTKESDAFRDKEEAFSRTGGRWRAKELLRQVIEGTKNHRAALKGHSGEKHYMGQNGDVQLLRRIRGRRKYRFSPIQAMRFRPNNVTATYHEFVGQLTLSGSRGGGTEIMRLLAKAFKSIREARYVNSILGGSLNSLWGRWRAWHLCNGRKRRSGGAWKNIRGGLRDSKIKEQTKGLPPINFFAKLPARN